LIGALHNNGVAAQRLIQDPPFFMFYAAASLSSGKFKQLNDVITQNRARLSPPLLFSLAGLYGRARRYRQVVSLLTRIPDAQADEAVYFNLGLAYSNLHRFDDARRSYFAAIDKHPGYAEAYLHVGIDYAESNQPRLALPWLYRARELVKRGDQAVVTRTGRSAPQENVDYALAQQLIRLRFFDSATGVLANDLASDANQPLLLTAMGDLELARGNYAKARDLYKKALTSMPTLPPALLGIGRCAKAEGKNEEAKKYFQEVLASDHNNPVAAGELGIIELNGGNPQAAVAYLERSWQFDSSNVSVGIALSRLYRQWKQPTRSLNRLKKLNPEQSHSLDLHLELSRVYTALRRTREAQAELERVKDLQGQKTASLHFEDPGTYVH
jgi:tetratricopeptide (TPR) repeat protein